MQRVTWPELSLNLSRLGFGCAPVMGSVGARAALNSMAQAYELGVTHFDVARSYGFGDAERILGKFIADKRSTVTVATKFGVMPVNMTAGKRLLRPLARTARRHLPGLRRAVKRTSAKSLVRGHYDLNCVTRSVETSLRELHIEAIDILFIHDCDAADDVGQPLADFLDGLVRSGKIRVWGLATRAAETDAVSRKLGRRPGVIQIPCAELQLIKADPARKILHGSISIAHRFYDERGGTLPPVAAWAKSHGLGIHEFSAALPRLLLHSALNAENGAVVICSMFTSSHIRANIQALEIGPELGVLAPGFTQMATTLMRGHPGDFGPP